MVPQSIQKNLKNGKKEVDIKSKSDTMIIVRKEVRNESY
jgi:hypothetical protein